MGGQMDVTIWEWISEEFLHLASWRCGWSFQQVDVYQHHHPTGDGIVGVSGKHEITFHSTFQTHFTISLVSKWVSLSDSKTVGMTVSLSVWQLPIPTANRSVNPSITQSINQSIKQLINLSIRHPFRQSVSKPVSQSIEIVRCPALISLTLVRLTNYFI